MDKDFPPEVLAKFHAFYSSLEKTKHVLSFLEEVNVNSTDLTLISIDRARLNLTRGYALNSLFWMYLSTLGIDPKSHEIKHELERFRDYTVKIKEIADKKYAPKLNKAAAGRFVKGALWKPKPRSACSSSSSDEEDHMSKKKKSQHRSHDEHNMKRRKH